MNKSRVRSALIGLAAITTATATWWLWPKDLLGQFYDWEIKTYHFPETAKESKSVHKTESDGKKLYALEYRSDLGSGSLLSSRNLCEHFIQFMTDQDGKDEKRDRFQVKVFKDSLLLTEDIPGQNRCKESATIPEK